MAQNRFPASLDVFANQLLDSVGIAFSDMGTCIVFNPVNPVNPV
ncbi:MAG: hypothetical protein P4L43_06830 [Syntrophobacteraceae bacterium]|nr:hypothetical protein [Syntrophobacteraceae bacterium]